MMSPWTRFSSRRGRKKLAKQEHRRDLNKCDRYLYMALPVYEEKGRCPLCGYTGTWKVEAWRELGRPGYLICGCRRCGKGQEMRPLNWADEMKRHPFGAVEE